MAVAWVTLPSGRNYDWGTSVTRTPRMEVHDFAMGRAARYTQGNNYNPRSMNVVFNDLSLADFVALNTYLEQNSDGRAITVPLLTEDSTGATTRTFYIVEFSHSVNNLLHTVNITLQQVYSTT